MSDLHVRPSQALSVVHMGECEGLTGRKMANIRPTSPELVNDKFREMVAVYRICGNLPATGASKSDNS